MDPISTTLYIGTGSSNTVPSGLDFTSGSWLSWIKLRDGSDSHFLSDSTQKTGTMYDSLASDRDYGKQTGESTGINSVGTSSYSISGGNAQVNSSTKKYVAWNFKAQEGFFDVVSWSGNSSLEQQISHSLGSRPGMVIVKRTDSQTNWPVWHVKGDFNPSEHRHGFLNSTTDFNNYGRFNNAVDQTTLVTDSYFTVRDDTNTNNATYVAYVFANDDARFGTNGNESIIKCGSFSSTGFVDLGWEPQWVIMKSVSDTNAYTGDWRIFDNMRGIFEADDAQLFANSSRAEDTGSFAQAIKLNSTGFTVESQGNYGTSTVYMAIRRPHKPPESATEVFDMVKRSNTDPNLFSTALPYVDVAWNKIISSSGSWHASSRLTIGSVDLDDDTAEDTSSSNVADIEYDFNNKINPGFPKSGGFDAVNYLFRRAPGFMDLLVYEGNGSNRQINHNLTVKPELMMFKRREASGRNWVVYAEVLGVEFHLHLDLSHAAVDNISSYFNDTEPTSSVVNLGNNNLTNNASGKYIAYLFASLPGISKIGTYDGTDNDIDVDCGFTAGSRFVMIKRTDETSKDWYVFDTTRGIVNGTETYLRINKDNAESSSGVYDYIDPLNSGFTITGSAPADLNETGGTYLFFAIA